MRAVKPGISYRAGLVDKVVTMHVVHVTIAIVVQPVVRNLPGIRPQVAHNVRVREVQTRVNDRHYDFVGGRPGQAPGAEKTNVGVGGTVDAVDGLAGVLQAPQLSEPRVVRCPHVRGPAKVIWLDQGHRGILAQLRNQGVGGFCG